MTKIFSLMGKYKLHLPLFFLGFITLQGCTLEGACEYHYSSTNNYYCDNVSDPNLLGLSTASDVCFYGDDNTFHDGSSCNSIGYNMSSNVGDYQYNANKDPSPYGAYSYASGSAGSATPCNWNTVWTGNPNDVQVSTQCQTACVYADGGSEQGRAASCAIVAQWGATTSCSICP